jgi:hypothetical protein
MVLYNANGYNKLKYRVEFTNTTVKIPQHYDTYPITDNTSAPSPRQCYVKAIQIPHIMYLQMVGTTDGSRGNSKNNKCNVILLI